MVANQKHREQKTYFIKTFGCRLNQAESGLVAEKLAGQKMSPTTLEKADRVVVNSCAVTGKAEKEVAQFVRRIRRVNPSCRLWLMGCGVFSNLPVDKMMNNEEKRRWLREGSDGKARGESGRKGLVKVQDGCDKFCSYCIVPYRRGRSISQSADGVVERVGRLAGAGVDWVVLTGVDVAQYQDGDLDFLGLVEKILSETKLPLLGFGSISPLIGREGGGKRLAGLYKKFPGRIARHLHLSLQSGSSRVLRLMKRDYSVEEYYRLARRLRVEIPGLNLTTDIIVGFPGEREADFIRTMEFVKKVGFGKVHIFRWSPRPGTLAAKKEDEWGRVAETVKKRRAERLARIEERLRKQFWQSLKGEQAWALVHPGRKTLGLYVGQTDNFAPVLIKGVKPEAVGRLVRVRLGKVRKKKLAASLVFCGQG